MKTFTFCLASAKALRRNLVLALVLALFAAATLSAFAVEPQVPAPPAPALPAGTICVKVSDAQGLPVKDAQVVAILKSGAYQDAKLDPADGAFKCLPTEECVKIYAAAPGFEACSQKYSGNAGMATVALKASGDKDSAIIRGRSPFPNIDGEIGLIRQ